MIRRTLISLLWIGGVAVGTSIAKPVDYRALQIDLSGMLQQQTTQHKASEAWGYGAAAQFNYSVGSRSHLFFSIGYDHMQLEQKDVLDEWDWDYWRDTYIEFIPGAQAEVINRTLTYTSTDSIYSAVFNPSQSLKELRLGLGVQQEFPLSEKMISYAQLTAGYTLFTRDLSMTENWTKRFKLDSLSINRFDYEYQYDLLHFAPPRTGTKLFAAPALGFRWVIGPGVDLNCCAQWIAYSNRNTLEWLENFLGVEPGGDKWFPLRSKMQLTLGLTFKY
ncbi:hypothetical protein JW992_00120 [candidate division KSB1 bacterium]|nr:hypothetical protein [candidate division KSB1 bacterium]